MAAATSASQAVGSAAESSYIQTLFHTSRHNTIPSADGGARRAVPLRALGLSSAPLELPPSCDSFFEALLIFFAVVRKTYQGKYGGVLGMLDLNQLGAPQIH